MNARTILALLAIVVAWSAQLVFAADTNIIPSLTIEGQTYTNVELGTVTGSRVAIFYDGGGKRVAISNLPPDLQRRLHYDPAAAHVADVAEAQRRTLELARSAELSSQTASNYAVAQYRTFVQKSHVGVRGHVIQRLADGSLLVASDGYSIVANYDRPQDPMVENTYNTFNGGNCYNGVCLVVRPQGHAANAIDGDLIYQTAYPSGTYTYEAVTGGRKTVLKFCADLDYLVRVHSTNSMSTSTHTNTSNR